jgi:uncharacterized MAPEG superfamily protein
MTTELTLLALTVVLGFVQILLAAHAKSGQYGYGWNLGARDKAMPPLDPVPGRLDRAVKNLLETFPFFAAAVLIAHVAGRDGALTWWGAQLYFWARVAYVPAYVAGVPLVRTLVWTVAATGIGLILVALI